MAIRAISIHAHFYQPPREDPLTGLIPTEKGAFPFNNWNEKIHAECYRPNALLRNFENISFNIGPTLFSWMQLHDPDTCRRIVEQDRKNVQRHGVGNAIAQAYNHTILPLASRQDKITQVYWGIADFEHRFGRKPKGMWLPETAVDYETLEILAQMGIEFTILAPWQANLDPIDTTRPYSIVLPKNNQMTGFFYQSDLSARISFDPGSTMNADTFAQTMLLEKFLSQNVTPDDPHLILMASDGELYGHHQQLRDHFLARLVDGASSSLGIRPTYPSLWLKHYPATHKIHIKEKTSWSCHHGVSRWLGQCNCTPGDAQWKAQLRYSFERLAAELDRLYLDVTSRVFSDPWELRNRYIHVILGETSLDKLANQMSLVALTSEQLRRVHLMLEMQRERQRMFTSCGWFFEDFDRIEPRNNVAYAAQAVYLARLATGVNLESYVQQDLGRVISPLTGANAGQLFVNHLRRADSFQKMHNIAENSPVGFAD